MTAAARSLIPSWQKDSPSLYRRRYRRHRLSLHPSTFLLAYHRLCPLHPCYHHHSTILRRLAPSIALSLPQPLALAPLIHPRTQSSQQSYSSILSQSCRNQAVYILQYIGESTKFRDERKLVAVRILVRSCLGRCGCQYILGANNNNLFRLRLSDRHILIIYSHELFRRPRRHGPFHSRRRGHPWNTSLLWSSGIADNRDPHSNFLPAHNWHNNTMPAMSIPHPSTTTIPPRRTAIQSTSTSQAMDSLCSTSKVQQEANTTSPSIIPRGSLSMPTRKPISLQRPRVPNFHR